ncbi:hypothetical protein CN692_09355 [Bacillus sp. AFS002410]|uniref:hypothetical protein n=1 Tax=Bacillus sp. AFS002410 TaxID=2033481 RepID=UPI000BF15AD0|nr:hypothetical protein [Bacillus sp. AFS002410]PEJ58467.1 hypothetical protein CN692_09355 [Bacillus sp. AFS002410]
MMKTKYSPPKSVKKTIRFIEQEATLDQLIRLGSSWFTQLIVEKKYLNYLMPRKVYVSDL